MEIDFDPTKTTRTDDGEVGDLSKVDAGVFRPAAEVLPPDFLAGLVAIKKQRGERGSQRSTTQVPTIFRFDADVLAALKACGKGWQTRVNEAVNDWLKTHGRRKVTVSSRHRKAC